MSHVDLGFSQESEPWRLESYQFPSKIGGKPAWLALENLPTSETLQCDTCQLPLIFLCQVYAPFEEDPLNFHRTVYVFLCRNVMCCVRNSNNNVKVIRCSLPRHNKFYSAEPPDDGKNHDFSVHKWAALCNLCGCLGEKTCSKCKKVNYCSREHQIIDWREGHKNECEKEKTLERRSFKLFSELEIVIESEEISEKIVNEQEELKKFERLKCEGNAGIMNEISESDMEQYAAFDSDKAFMHFKKRISENNGQVLRYERGGQPLWIANDPKPDLVPNCEHCHSDRRFEFQIMPQLFSILHENDLDVGILAVYTCSKSCTDGDYYKKEFIFKQDVSNSV